jgi:hypothetical protein
LARFHSPRSVRQSRWLADWPDQITIHGRSLVPGVDTYDMNEPAPLGISGRDGGGADPSIQMVSSSPNEEDLDSSQEKNLIDDYDHHHHLEAHRLSPPPLRCNRSPMHDRIHHAIYCIGAWQMLAGMTSEGCALSAQIPRTLIPCRRIDTCPDRAFCPV